MIELFSFDDDKGAQELVFSELDDKTQDLFARVCVRKCGAALLQYLDTYNNSMHTIQDIAYQIREETTEVECGLRTLTELELTRVSQTSRHLRCCALPISNSSARRPIPLAVNSFAI